MRNGAMDIWQACRGPDHIRRIDGALFRLVESQEQIATLSYVDTLEEQAALEELLENVKPQCAPNTQALHYLLQSPFRYPPLPWGSRFGHTHERGILYGGHSVPATLAEAAYYRLVFWESMPPHPTRAHIDTAHTMFSVTYGSDAGVQLHASPFSGYSKVLTHPRDYTPTQALGSAMRAAGVQAFEYMSARDKDRGLCIGLFTPDALTQRAPDNVNQWLCQTTADGVNFKPFSHHTVHDFPREQFEVEGGLPLPA